MFHESYPFYRQATQSVVIVVATSSRRFSIQSGFSWEVFSSRGFLRIYKIKINLQGFRVYPDKRSLGESQNLTKYLQQISWTGQLLIYVANEFLVELSKSEGVEENWKLFFFGKDLSTFNIIFDRKTQLSLSESLMKISQNLRCR